MASSLLSKTKSLSKRVNKTHEGGDAKILTESSEDQLKMLRRSIMCYMLWEDQFYESGVEIAKRISDTVKKVPLDKALEIAVEAKVGGKLRHAPLFLLVEVIKNKPTFNYVGVFEKLILRSDELMEMLALYWKDGKKPLPAQMKKGLAKAFGKFTEYQLSRAPKDKTIKLRDVMRLVHPTPKDDEQSAMWKRMIAGELATPDTWQVRLSAGQNKKETFELLLDENKLGPLDILRNLNNMSKASVTETKIVKAVMALKTERVLPFQFISASKYAGTKTLKNALEAKMLECVNAHDKLLGKTLLLVDTSGSMSSKISGKSELSNIDAAAGISILVRELCEEVVTYEFNNNEIVVKPELKGFALAEYLAGRVTGGTELSKSLTNILKKESGIKRIIIFTDEQSRGSLRGIALGSERNYLVNVAANKNGIDYDDGNWVHISGWSEKVMDYITESERVEYSVVD